MLPHWLFIVKLFYEKSCVFHFLGYGYDGNKFITCHANLRIHNTYNIVLSNKDIIPLIYNLCKYSNVTVILQLLCSIITSICLIISIFFLWILLLFPIYYFVSLSTFILTFVFSISLTSNFFFLPFININLLRICRSNIY